MPKKTQKRPTNPCECSLLADPFFCPSWTNQPCPFIASKRYKQSQEHQYEILQLLECQCGKQVGERIFSSDRLIGFWRSSNYISFQANLQDMNQKFQATMGKIISKNINLLTLYENKEKQPLVPNPQNINITPLKVATPRSKSKKKNRSQYK